MKRLALVLVIAACNDGGSAVAPAPGSASAPHARDAGAGSAAAETASDGWVGVIAASELVDISPLAAGKIDSVKVRPGDLVKAGDVLVEMNPTSMQEALRAAQSDLAAAQAAYAQASVDVQDARRKLALETKAVAEGVSPRQNVEEARLALKRAQANAEKASADVSAAQARRDTARDHVADTTLRATFDGTVAGRSFDAGATVSAGQAIVRIARGDSFRLKFAVPPDKKGAFASGTAVVAKVDTVKTPIDATVRAVAPQVDKASGLFFVEADLSPDPAVASQLAHGLRATVQLATAIHPSPASPP